MSPFKVILHSLVALLTAVSLVKGAAPEDLSAAAVYFHDAKEICDRDGGELWGVNLYAPVLFIDGGRNIIANESQEGFLTAAAHGLYTGRYPVDKPVANSITELDGKKWTMVMWPLPADPLMRNILLVHEMFHYRQDELGLSPEPYSNEHMQETEARILLKLEWAALAHAINSDNVDEYMQAVGDALAFRNLRRARFENSALNENPFEIHEGMPEYTARKLCCGTDEEIENLILKEINPETDKSFVRTFAYLSGPLYGYLLDKSGAQWRSRVAPDSDLGQMLAGALGLRYGEAATAEVALAGEKYGYHRIADFEYGMAAELEAKISQYRGRLVSGPRLKIPMVDISVSFNPMGVYSLGESGTVYETLRLVTAAGILEVEQGGGLISPDWQTAYVTAEGLEINGPEVSGRGWRMSLSPDALLEEEGQNRTVVLKD